MWPTCFGVLLTGAAKPGGGARVDDLGAAVAHGAQHVGLAAQEIRPRPCLETRACKRGHFARDRPALRAPAREAAVEQRHVRVSGVAQGPPDAPRGVAAEPVVHHHVVVRSDPALRERAGQRVRRRHRVAQRRADVGEVGRQVEEHGAGNVRGRVLRARVALHRGQVPAAVDHAQFGIREPAARATRARPGAATQPTSTRSSRSRTWPFQSMRRRERPL